MSALYVVCSCGERGLFGEYGAWVSTTQHTAHRHNTYSGAWVGNRHIAWIRYITRTDNNRHEQTRTDKYSNLQIYIYICKFEYLSVRVCSCLLLSVRVMYLIHAICLFPTHAPLYVLCLCAVCCVVLTHAPYSPNKPRSPHEQTTYSADIYRDWHTGTGSALSNDGRRRRRRIKLELTASREHQK